MKNLLFVGVLSLMAQIAVSQVVVLNYMKVPEGGEEMYEAAEEYARKVHQARVENGTMLGWELYRVHDQEGESPYDYVAVDVYKDLASRQAGISDELLKKVLGDESEKIVEEIMASREWLYSETLNFKMRALSGAEEENFIIVNYMKAADPEKHFEMEKTAFLPLHQKAIESGQKADWSVWTPVVENGKPEYTAVVVDGFSSMEKLENQNYQVIYDEYIKDKSQDEIAKMQKYFDSVEEIREMVLSQVWEKISSTTPVE